MTSILLLGLYMYTFWVVYLDQHVQEVEIARVLNYPRLDSENKLKY
jgi:hypothetical protein